MIKTCAICKQDKSLEDFNYKDKKKNQRGSYCKSCQKDYRKNHYEENKSVYINKAVRWKAQTKKEFVEWLSSQKCKDCGVSDYRILEFDHLDNKSFNISEKFGTRRLASLLTEIQKCDIVCANCHRIRTSERGDFYKFMRE